MEKKKVAILLPWMKMGGTNKVALRFIKELKTYCNVTLILSQNTGELLEEIPDGVKLLIDQMLSFRDVFKDDIRKFKILNLIKDIVYYAKIRMGKDSIDNYLYLVQRQTYITNEEFDCAISYHGQSPERLLNLIYRIHSKKKVAWIHGKMSFNENTCHRMEKYYQQLDHFYFVSNNTKESFIKAIHIKDISSEVYYNPIDKDEILSKAVEGKTSFSSDRFNIVTVGRVSSEKGQDMIPFIVKKLQESGRNVVWYVIGDGPDMGTVKHFIKEQGVGERVKLLGVKNNPYGYMKAADLYVQPSYTEGYSTTICEAGILGKAIVGTKPSGGIYDQITDGVDGLIVDATVDGLFEGIAHMYDDSVLRKIFETNILNKNFEGKGEINKFLDYING